MDGTLLDGEGRIPDAFIPLLGIMADRGIVFAPASGRQYATLAGMFGSAPGHLAYIAENGSIVVQDDQVISTTYLDAPTVRTAIDLVRRATATRDVGLVVCGQDSAYIERHDRPFVKQCEPYYAELALIDDLTTVTDNVLKVAIYDFEDSETCVDELFGDLQATHQVAISGQHWIDIMNAEANKGVAVLALQERLGIMRDQTVVFGDYLNDLEMMTTGEWSYAMENAHPAVRDQARFVAPANTESGVITVLSALLNGRQP